MGVNSLLQLAQATRRHSQGRGALTTAGVGRHHRHVLGGAHGRTKTAPIARCPDAQASSVISSLGSLGPPSGSLKPE